MSVRRTRQTNFSVASHGVAQGVPDLPHDDLYFVRAGPFVKVGRTSNLDARLISIQTGCPYPIESAFSFCRMGMLEKELHADLRDCRANGEWFHWGEQPERQLNEMRRRAFVWQQAEDFLQERAPNKRAQRVQIPYNHGEV